MIWANLLILLLISASKYALFGPFLGKRRAGYVNWHQCLIPGDLGLLVGVYERTLGRK